MLDRFLRPAQIKTNQDGALLRLIACICMFIDHAGKMLFPQLTWMRLVGRLAFPLFAYGIAVGAAMTKHPQPYITRVAALALVSQPLYAVALGSAKDYLELSSSNLESQLNLGGVTVEKNEIGEIEINGSAAPCLYVTLTYSEQGVTLYEFIIAEKRGSRFAVITAGSLFEERLAELAKAVTIG